MSIRIERGELITKRAKAALLSSSPVLGRSDRRELRLTRRWWVREDRPEALQMETDDSRRERARWIHRCAADRAGKQCFQSNDGPDDDSRGDSLFPRAGGDAKNYKHQQRGQD